MAASCKDCGIETYYFPARKQYIQMIKIFGLPKSSKTKLGALKMLFAAVHRSAHAQSGRGSSVI
jgi:hypothetical protein